MRRIHLRWHSSTLKDIHFSTLELVHPLLNHDRAGILALQIRCQFSAISDTFRLRCTKRNTITAPKASAKIANPTPNPTFVPVKRPEDGCGVLVAGGIITVELVAKVEVVELVAEVEVVDEKVV